MKNNKKKYKESYFLRDVVWGFASIWGYVWFRPKRYYVSDKAKPRIKGGALLISNHVGFHDPVYIMMCLNYRRHHFIAAKEMFPKGFKKFLFERVFFCIGVDRENVSPSFMREVIGRLKDGQLVSMFPEGHINQQSEGVAEFKNGAVFMALKAGVPIVPVYIHKRKNIFERLKMVVGEPIELSLADSGMTSSEYLAAMSEELRQKELELAEYYRQNIENRKGKSKRK